MHASMVEAQNRYGPKDCVYEQRQQLCCVVFTDCRSGTLFTQSLFVCSHPSLQGLPSPKHQLTVRCSRAAGHTHPSGLHRMGELMALHCMHDACMATLIPLLGFTG